MPVLRNKNITIDFYSPRIPNDSGFSVADHLLSVVNDQGGNGKIWIQSGFIYEVRGVFQEGPEFRGAFVKIRSDQIPHAGSPGGVEREIGLRDNEGLIEKNHFIYRPGDELLIYESNGHGSRVSKLGAYLSSFAGETVTFDAIVQGDALRRLMRNGVEPVRLELSFTRPRNPELYPEGEWNNEFLRLLNGVGGANVNLKVSADKSSDDGERNRLKNTMKNVAEAWAASGITRVLRMGVLENGVEHPIDFVMDRIRSKKSVEMLGKYPSRDSIYGALSEAFSDEQQAIYEVIGEPGRRLR